MLFSSLAHANESRARLEAQLSNSAAAASVSKSDEITNGKQLKELESSAEEGGGKRRADENKQEVNFGGGDGWEEGGVTLQQVQTNDGAAESEAADKKAGVDMAVADNESTPKSVNDKVNNPIVQNDAPDHTKTELLQCLQIISKQETLLLTRDKIISNLEAQLRIHKEQSTSKSNTISWFHSEVEKLKQRQNQREQFIQSAEKRATELLEEIQVLLGERKEHLGKITELKDTIATKQSKKWRDANLELEKQLKDAREENNSLKKEVEDARAGAAAAIELERESSKRDLVAARDESERLRAANLELERQLKAAKKEAEDARAGAAAAIESERESSKRDLVAARDESERLRAANLELERQLKAAKKEAEDARAGAAIGSEGEDLETEDEAEVEQEEDGGNNMGGGAAATDGGNDGGPNNPIVVGSDVDDDADDGADEEEEEEEEEEDNNDANDDGGDGGVGDDPNNITIIVPTVPNFPVRLENTHTGPTEADIIGVIKNQNCHHPGNRRYRATIAKYRADYRRVRLRVLKDAIAKQVYNALIGHSNPSRFFKLVDGVQVEMSPKEAIDKKIKKDFSKNR